MNDVISREAAIEALSTPHGILYPIRTIEELPSVQPQQELITWLLDEIWDDDAWELNCGAFPEILCRKLVKLGYVAEEGGEYVRIDKPKGGD